MKQLVTLHSERGVVVASVVAGELTRIVEDLLVDAPSRRWRSTAAIDCGYLVRRA